MVNDSKEDSVEVEVQGHKAILVEVTLLVYMKWKNLHKWKSTQQYYKCVWTLFYFNSKYNWKNCYNSKFIMWKPIVSSA